MRGSISKFVLPILLYACFPAVQSQTIYLKSFEPSVDSLPIEAIKKITFSSGQLIAEMSGDKTINFGIANLRFMSCSSELADVNSAPNAFEVLAYPNPVNNLLNLQVGTSVDVKINLFTVDGQKLNAPVVKSDSFHYQINVSALKSGCYFCSVLTENYNSVVRFVKF